MNAANYNRPKPVSPLGAVTECWLRIHCGCGRTHSEPVIDVMLRHRLSPRLFCYQLIAKLRCSACGAKPNVAEVVRYLRE